MKRTGGGKVGNFSRVASSIGPRRLMRANGTAIAPRPRTMTTQQLGPGLLGLVAVTSQCLGASGCGHGALVPAPSAQVIAGAPKAAYSENDGVGCSADVGAWPERAKQPPVEVVPVKVRIRNNSGKAIRLLADDFVLVGKSGHRYRPVPVLPLDGATRPRVNPTFASMKFYVAPRLSGAYPTLDPWATRLARDEAAYDRQFRRWGKEQPTTEMIRMALPEGVLDDGGLISGFVYFESPLDEEDRVTFQADFEQGDGSGTVASVEIPFRVR
jgi:hypothetical protein